MRERKTEYAIDELEAQVIDWRSDPFNPHAIARLRQTAYAKAVFHDPANIDAARALAAARRAEQIGLYNYVYPDEELAEKAYLFAHRLANGPTMGLAVTKRMLNAEASMELGEAMQAEGWIQAECMKHPDYREAFDAFTERRKPDFTRFLVRPGEVSGSGAQEH